ncbi:MAG: hypothetical protein AAGA60_17475 [Cyanobacteria bacterium P01_E01_bin.42]
MTQRLPLILPQSLMGNLQISVTAIALKSISFLSDAMGMRGIAIARFGILVVYIS